MNKLEGLRFGKLTIINIYLKEYGIQRHSFAKCICDCGNTKEIFLRSLKSGYTLSCGCYRKETSSKNKTKTGMTSGGKTHPIYTSRTCMRSRCKYKTDKKYQYYGGKGIKVAPEWNNFEVFYNDMGKLRSENMTLDRIDSNGNYCKENCRRISRKEQNRNKNNNILYKGKCISQWSEELGLNRNLIYNRLSRGRNFEDAISIETRGKTR